MDSFPGVDELKKLRVVDLKERLSKYGKSTSGLKADLVDRLYNVLREEAASQGEQDQEQGELGGYGEGQCNTIVDNKQPPVVEVVIDTSQFGGIDQSHHDPYTQRFQVENQMMPQYAGGHIVNVSNQDVGGSMVHDQQQHSFNVQQDEYSPPVDLSMQPVQQIQLQQPLMFVEMQPMRQMDQQQQQQQQLAHSPIMNHSRMVIPSSPVAQQQQQQQHSPVATMIQSSPDVSVHHSPATVVVSSPPMAHHSPIFIHSSPGVDQHMILSPHSQHSPLVLTSPSVHQVVLQPSPSEVQHHSPMYVQSPGSDHIVQMVTSSPSASSIHHQTQQMFGVQHSVEQQQQQQQQQHEAAMMSPRQITIFTSPQHHQMEQHSPMVVTTHQPSPQSIIESTHFVDESSQQQQHHRSQLEPSDVPPPMSPNIQVYQVPIQQQTPPSTAILLAPQTDQVSIAVPLTSSIIPLESSTGQPQIVVPSNVAVESQMWAQPVTMTQSVVYEPIPPPPCPPNVMEVPPPVVTTRTSPQHTSCPTPPSSAQHIGPPSPSVGRPSQPPSLMSLDVAKPAVLEDDDAKNENDEVHLPQALEKALAFKSERALELGVDSDVSQSQTEAEEEKVKEAEVEKAKEVVEEEAVEVEVVPEKVPSPAPVPKSLEPKPSKNKRRKLKKKKRAKHRRDAAENALQMDVSMNEETGEAEDVEVQYVQDSLDLNPSDPMYGHFMKIFEAFKLTDPETAKREAEEAAARAKAEAKKEPDLRKKPKDADEEPELDIKAEEVPKLSKRKMKMLNQLSIAELKQHVNRPDVVEMHDVTAKDPKLLVILKSTRNTVSVPRHWCFKRKYLQGKRGIEKPPFNLPDFIKKTGIMEMRQALQEKEDQKTMKAKMRERVRPKMGKIDIDYQKLHDAFFKWQTKPRMTIHGDLYYEGKELETRLREKKPGDLSTDLRNALGMPTGPNSHKVPPPWLIAMQRYGPPPSYPNLKIPGLNSPIPDNCSFGYHAGGWGKPPVDEMGKPLYGDVFGTAGGEYNQPMMEEEIDRTLWGELESESESESEEEEEEEEEAEGESMEQEDIDRSGLATPSDGGLITPSGISSIPAGMETPDMIELRKRKIESEMENVDTPSLYTILPEKRADRLGAAMMGSTHIYDITAAMPGRVRPPGMGGGAEGGVEVALDPSELDMDSAAMAARYEQTLREQQNQLEKEDLSDMVAEHTAKQKNKRKRAAGQQDSGRSTKKYKDFKF